ncbi:MAG: YceI family protein [Balneolaceae bacterium]
MKKSIIYSLTLIILFVFSSATAQDVTLNLSEIQQFKIDGDSNVKSWDADVTEATAILTLSDIENITLEALTPETIQSLVITIPVSGIQSDSGRLTKNMHEYLKMDDHPQITYQLTDVTSVEYDGEIALITADGVINVAGVELPVTMNVEAAVSADGVISFSGSQDLLMTSFDIDPPTAVLGTIRAHDEITILHQVSFSR